jgi:lysine 2,3-aminomutase
MMKEKHEGVASLLHGEKLAIEPDHLARKERNKKTDALS